MKYIIASVVVAGALFQAPARAEGLDNLLTAVDFSYSGYGTAGVARSSTGDAQFIRGQETRGATQGLAADVDSNLGLQATARFNSWLTATAQVTYDSNVITDAVSWLYLKVEPTDFLTIKLGKMEIPVFAISDSLDVNYANTWLRPPNEVYGLSILKELKGGEATYHVPLGPTQLSLTVYAGNSVSYTTSSNLYYNTWDVHGGELRWETPWATLRGSYTTTENEVAPGMHDRYTFSGVGVLVDKSDVVAQAEYVSRKSQTYGPYVNSTGWYVLGGYRFGKVLPYASYASTPGTDVTFYAISGKQSTASLGVRWDAFRSADLKFQLDRVDTHHSTGISFIDEKRGFGGSPTNVVSLTLDFVFGG